MIILFKENETKFDSLGIGVLKDATSCLVSETLNDTFELELEYPIFGQNYSEIKIDSIIYSKSSPTSNYQPFRVYSISKPLKGLVTIKALHISYDMNGIVVGPISEGSLQSTLNKLETESLLPHNFKFFSKVQSTKTYATTDYYNLRALLFGSDNSILETYNLEVKFEGFNVYLLERRGSDKNAEIRYGKNMTELEHEFNHDLLYNYVYPYYHKESTSQSTVTNPGEFKQVYIVGKKPLQDGWLSYEENGEPYHPIDEAPVQVATEGDYFKKIFTWDTTRQKYRERLYEQQVTLIEGVTAPEWIEIDWSGLPSIVVRAKQPGYFKSMTDTEYKYANIGDIVFSGSIRTITQNLMLYYSEVIPPSESELTNTETSVTHVELPNKLLKVNTELANKMTFNRVLSLNLTDEFEENEEANEETLTSKALKFIKDNKIGQYKYNTTVSFVDLSTIDDNVVYKNLEQVELGDTIKIIYEALDINVELRVITTIYDALLDRYSSIELGEKSDTISSTSVQTGDSVSALVNDKGYTDEKTVSSIVTHIVTADYIEASNARLSKAQIEELSTARIKVTGMLEASQAEIDRLVAKLLVADNAVIKETLEAGEVKVSGDITVKSGEISIENEDGSKVFRVDREGNLYATSATVKGRIEASEGNIGGFHINSTSIWNNIDSMHSDNDNGVYIGPDGISLGKQLKIYPNGLIISHTYTDQSTIAQLLIPSKIKPALEFKPNRSTVSFNAKIIDTATTPDDITNYYNTVQTRGGSYTMPYLANVSESGTVTNGDGTTISVLQGDNLISSSIVVDGVTKFNWRKINQDEFNNAYSYLDNGSANALNSRLQNNTYQEGDICKILEDERILSAKEYDENFIYNTDMLCINSNKYYKCLEDNVTGAWDSSKWVEVQPSDYHKLYSDTEDIYLQVNVDDYVILAKTQYYGAKFEFYITHQVYNRGDICRYQNNYYMCRADHVTGTWNSRLWIRLPGKPAGMIWKKFYIPKDYNQNYFGITPEGILYANGAIISGDVTVKSGEISIESSDGSKVFRVDREGNLYATSATIKGKIEADEGDIAGFSISRQESASDRIYGIYYNAENVLDEQHGKSFMQIAVDEYASQPYPFIYMESKSEVIEFSTQYSSLGRVKIAPSLGVTSDKFKVVSSSMEYPGFYNYDRTYNRYSAAGYINAKTYCKYYDYSSEGNPIAYFRCLEDGTTGPWDPSKWELCDGDIFTENMWTDSFATIRYDDLASMSRIKTQSPTTVSWHEKPNHIVTIEHTITSANDVIDVWDRNNHIFDIIGAQITPINLSSGAQFSYEKIYDIGSTLLSRSIRLIVPSSFIGQKCFITVYCHMLSFEIARDANFNDMS